MLTAYSELATAISAIHGQARWASVAEDSSKVVPAVRAVLGQRLLTAG